MAERNRPPKIYYKPVIRAPVEKHSDDETYSVKRELWQEAVSWAKTIVITMMFAFVITNFIIMNAWVPSASMEDTIRTNDRLIAFRLSYLFREPERYDIVVFRGERINYVKRIIGLPGEELVIRNGHVYINGSDVPQRYDFVKGSLSGNHGPFVIPEGYFFVLGDWRDNSEDSRRWEQPFISRGRLQGRAIFRFFPGFANLTNR